MQGSRLERHWGTEGGVGRIAAGKLPEEGDRGVSDTAKQVYSPPLHAFSPSGYVASRR